MLIYCILWYLPSRPVDGPPRVPGPGEGVVLGRGGGGVQWAGGGEEVEPQLGGEVAPAHRQAPLQLPPAGAGAALARVTAGTSSQPWSGNSGQHSEA